MIMATRLLRLSRAVSDIDIPIRIFAPERSGSAWSCRYEIDWPEGKETMSASGIDSVQALVLALQMIGADIYSSSYQSRGSSCSTRRGAATDFQFRAACGTCWSGMTGFMAPSF
jgi:hypothetical protein